MKESYKCVYKFRERSPLHYAVTYKALDVIPLLIAAGAKVDVRMDGIYTPLDVAIDMENEAARTLLLKFIDSAGYQSDKDKEHT